MAGRLCTAKDRPRMLAPGHCFVLTTRHPLWRIAQGRGVGLGEWLAKFEQLLSGIDGEVPTVHLQTELVGNHTYIWLRTNYAPADWPPVWAFKGGMRSF
ncbi:MAG: hypothetical protein ACO1PM_01255 [Acidovorax sp.]